MLYSRLCKRQLDYKTTIVELRLILVGVVKDLGLGWRDELAQQERNYYVTSMKRSESLLSIALASGSSPDYAHHIVDNFF